MDVIDRNHCNRSTVRQQDPAAELTLCDEELLLVRELVVCRQLLYVTRLAPCAINGGAELARSFVPYAKRRHGCAICARRR